MPRGQAPAKVNLYLEVVGRRPDGYHDLRTLFQTVDWGDGVEVERTATSGVVCETQGAVLPSDDANLAVRAAREWLEAAQAPGGAHVRLEKRIPLGAGLGGGSSDAAAVLRLLQTTPGALPHDRLMQLAVSLGADVPFLIEGGTAVGTGRGDVIEPRPPAPRIAIVLMLAPFPTSTATVFGRVAERLRRAPEHGLEKALEALASGVPEKIRDAHHNDLAEASMRAYGEMLRFASTAEKRLGRPPCVTGSGSTLFDVPDVGEVDEVLARLQGLQGRRQVVWATAGSPS